MVEMLTPRAVPTARPAGRVSDAGSRALKELSAATQMAADTFSEHYEKKAAIEGDLLLAQIQEEWGREYKERAANAGSGFASRTMADYDKFIEQKLADYQQRMSDQNMAQVPARNREDIQLVLDKYRIRLEGQALAREAAARAAAAARARAEASRLRANAILSDPTLAEDAIAAAPDAATRSTYIRAQLNALLLHDDPQAVADMMAQGTYDADLSTSQKLSFMKAAESGLDSLDREQAIALANEQQAFESDREEALLFAQANGFVPPAMAVEAEDFAVMYPDDPARAAAVQTAYDEGLAYSEAMYDVSLASPSDIEAQMDALGAAVLEPGQTDRDVKRRNAYVAAVQDRNTAISEDAAGFVVGHEDTMGQLYDLVSQATAAGSDGVAETSAYLSGLNLIYDRMGVPQDLRTVLPKASAVQMTSMVNSVGSDVAAQTLTGITEQWGGAAPMLIAQLEREGLAPEYVAAMRFADKPGLSQEIIGLAGVPVTDLRAGLETTEVTDLGRNMSTLTTEYRQAFEVAGTSTAIATMNTNFEIAEKLALKYVRGGMDAGTAADRAVSQMFPEEPIINNNMMFLLPEGLTERSATRALENAMEPEALRAADIEPINDLRFPDFADKEVTIEAASSAGVWVNNSIGDGVQLMVSVDGTLLPLFTTDGQLYEIKFVDVAPVARFGFANPERGGLVRP